MFWSRRSVNYWPDNQCAKAFWNQHELPPYRQLLADTTAGLDPQPGERWLDLGCGRGMLSRAVWERSAGTAGEVVGIDIAAANAEAYEKLKLSLTPRPQRGQVRFIAGDFLTGLAQFATGSVDGIISGLALSYAESYCEQRRQWTTDALDRTLAECRRVLKSTGRFVFSINVPNPAWHKVAIDCLRGTKSARAPHRYLLRSWRIYRYGGWLKRESRRGRFHYLPLDVLTAKLHAAGFGDVVANTSFCGQAFVINCRSAGRVAAAA